MTHQPTRGRGCGIPSIRHQTHPACEGFLQRQQKHGSIGRTPQRSGAGLPNTERLEVSVTAGQDTGKFPQTPIGLFPSYDAWSSALAAHFFGPRYRGRPVYLQVDGDTLKEIGPAIGLAPDSSERVFIHAVRTVVQLVSARPFWRIEQRMSSWRRSPNRRSQPPPCLAFLGLCVLAASHMQRDDDRGIGPNNYYRRLNELLGRDALHQPPDFDIATGYWSEVRRWLNSENRGELGVCTAAPIGRFTFIGYPISQCLLREADRARLPDFFDHAQIAPRADVEPQDLIRPLERWVQMATCGLSARAKRLLLHGSPDVREQIAAIVAEEARLWGGEIRDATGQRVAPFVVWLEPSKGGHEFDIQFFPRRPEGFPAGTYQSAQSAFELVPLEGAEWYEPLPLDPQRALDKGLELRQGRFMLRWNVTEVIVAGRDMELGGYTSQPQAPINAPLILVSRAHLQTSLEQFLERYAAPGWKRAPGTKGLPSGWQAYLDVVIQSRPTWIRPEFACLVPEPRVSIRLEGGFKLDASTWLANAEPTVRISADESTPFDVKVDGRPLLQSGARIAEFDLSTIGLGPGEHTVTAGGRTRRFETCRSGDYRSLNPEDGSPPYLGYIVSRRGVRFEASYPSPRPVDDKAIVAGELKVIGAVIRGHKADLPENLPGPVMLPGGSRRYILLGPCPGMVFECRDPRMPMFACFRRGAMPLPFEATPPFLPVWLIRVSWRRHFSLLLIGKAAPPSREVWSSDNLQAWVRWIRKRYQRGLKGEAATLWQEYIRIARSL